MTTQQNQSQEDIAKAAAKEAEAKAAADAKAAKEAADKAAKQTKPTATCRLKVQHDPSRVAKGSNETHFGYVCTADGSGNWIAEIPNNLVEGEVKAGRFFKV